MVWMTRDEIPNGTHSLTTYSLEFLERAQTLFGEALIGEQNFIYGGIEFDNRGPRLIFPRNKYVVIQITPDCVNDILRGVFQLSHEVAHLLSPIGSANVNNLEEGIATYFSYIVLDEYFDDAEFAMRGIDGTDYERPFQLVRDAYNYNSSFVRNLRQRQPIISRVGSRDFNGIEIGLDDSQIDFLTERFS